MTIQYKLLFAGMPDVCHTVPDEDSPHLQVMLKLDGGFYNPYYAPAGGGPVKISEIEVYYSGSSVDEFRLRGITDDAGPPTINAIRHIASGGFSTHVDWSVNSADPRQIDWTFREPPRVGDWVSWYFNPSGTAPPVKIKVVLKRQEEPLPSCS